jgi:hypothetical protein|tara:strand:+ start:122 stop:298 length:177 start_codon:yes stop_codon:yes gene_type:complete
MKNQYSVDEILEAVNELNSLRKDKNIDIVTSHVKKKTNNDIPDYTISLIEEAEKSKSK